MSGADQATAAIHKAARGVYAPVHAAGVAYVKAHQAAMGTADVEDAMRSMVELIVAAEGLKDAATEAERSARSALATAIQDTGAPEVATMHHKAYLSRKSAWVSVDQSDLLPPEFWNKPTPDKKAIKDAIEHGSDVPGCTLVRPNDMTLSIRARK